MIKFLKTFPINRIKGCRHFGKDALAEWHRSSPYPHYDPWFTNTTRGDKPRTLTGGKYTISAIPGVGIGPELMEHLIEVFECIGAPVVFEWLPPDKGDLLEFKNYILSIKRNGVAIRGNIEDKRPMEFAGRSEIISKNSAFRKDLDLFVNVSRFRNFKALKDLVKIKKDIDIVVMRANHEGEYHLLEHSPLVNLVESYKVVSAYNIKRLAHYAFDYAIRHKRKKITLARETEVGSLCDLLFAKSVTKVAKVYPSIDFEYLSDAAIVQKAMKTPEDLDLLLCNGLSGSQLAPMLNGIVGGETLACFGEISERYKVFQPAGRPRGTKLVKQNTANPTSLLLAGASALHSVGALKHCKYITDGLEETFKEGVRTAEIGGNATTTEFIRALIENVKSKAPTVLCKHDLPLDAKHKIAPSDAWMRRIK